MINFIKSIVLLFPLLLSGQNVTVKIVGDLDKKPLMGIQILSETGSFISESNSNGGFDYNLALLKDEGVKNVVFYDSNYLPVEYKIDEIPSIIYLKKIKSYELESVLVTNPHSKKYFILKGYCRSWKLVNNKLVKYGDGLIDYRIPYSKRDENVEYNIKNYVSAYRTFMIDSIKPKSRIVSISIHDRFLDCYLPKSDILKSAPHYYKSVKEKDSLYVVLHEGEKTGYAIYDKNDLPAEINVSESFEKEEEIKLLIWKISGKFKNIEKWTGEGNTRHPSYLFSSKKIMVKTKFEGKFNNVETVTELFIDDFVYNDEKPLVYKSYIDKDRSFYNSNYWDEQLVKHPLLSEIKAQLTNVNENKNNY
ncbi:hypothetical protein [Flavobacterium sp. ZB4R12]|uniref:hypothetical protein n=1 Tax=Flavobacterium sp. ZB4R12 TaxID=3398732 RepID=UPI003AAF1D28